MDDFVESIKNSGKSLETSFIMKDIFSDLYEELCNITEENNLDYIRDSVQVYLIGGFVNFLAHINSTYNSTYTDIDFFLPYMLRYLKPFPQLMKTTSYVNDIKTKTFKLYGAKSQKLINIILYEEDNNINDVLNMVDLPHCKVALEYYYDQKASIPLNFRGLHSSIFALTCLEHKVIPFFKDSKYNPERVTKYVERGYQTIEVNHDNPYN